MKIPFPAKVTMDSVFVWLMHRISEEFKDHAILKGGIALRLVNCPRSTNDIDYVFVPYRSKKEIVDGLNKILKEIPGAEISRSMSSRSLKFVVRVAGVSAQIEASVSDKCKAMAMSTGSLARLVNELGRVIRIMSFDVALSHKLAAWNERRLMRDIYDVYYIYQMMGVKPDIETLLGRLGKIESRLPEMKGRKKMKLGEFADEIGKEAGKISAGSVKRELSPLLKEEELAGLDIKLKVALTGLAEFLKRVR